MKAFPASAESSLGLPPNSYIYSITSTSAQNDVRIQSFPNLTSSDQLVVISSDESIRSLDPETLKTINVIKNTHSSITSLKRYATPGAQCSTFMTSGRDGRVRGWDLRSGSEALEFSAPKSEPLSALDCNAGLQVVVAGTELEGNAPGDVGIFGWDVRMPREVKMKYEECHNDTVTELRFLPAVGSTNTLLLSAGTDGMVNIFNTATAEEDDALLQVIKSASALQHAGLIDGDIYALGTDETLAFYAFQSLDLKTEDPPPCLLGDVREDFNCEYVVNMYEAGSKQYLAVGNHSEQWLDLVRFKNKATAHTDIRKWKPKSSDDKKIRLVGAHGEELVRDVFIPTGAKVVYTCGEDGMMRQWRVHEDDDGDVEMGGTAKVGMKRKSERSDRKNKRSKAGLS
jgi:WD40 repeat protein